MIRVFISYAHEGENHKKWVLERANDLSRRGFDVILDQLHLKFGQDIDHFVESAIESSDFVLLICTPAYATKANSRRAGVGKETVIINSEISEGASEKFIAVLKSGEPRIAIPKYMKTRLFVDLTGNDAEENWEQLCTHMANHGPADQIGTLFFEALFPYDPQKIYAPPRLQALKRFTQFIKTGQNEAGRWFVVRRDPIKNDLATIYFQDPID